MRDADILKLTGVYKITNRLNGKFYVGSASQSFARRFARHISFLRSGSSTCRLLQAAFNKHGEDAFEFKPLLVCAPEDCLRFEQAALDALQPVYNILKVAGSTRGYRHTPESIAKFSNKLRGKPLSLNHREVLSRAHKGKILSESHRKSLSKSARNGRPRPMGSKNGKAKITEAQVMRVWKLIGSGLGNREILSLTGVNEHAVCAIRIGRRWSWLTKTLDK